MKICLQKYLKKKPHYFLVDDPNNLTKDFLKNLLCTDSRMRRNKYSEILTWIKSRRSYKFEEIMIV